MAMRLVWRLCLHLGRDLGLRIEHRLSVIVMYNAFLGSDWLFHMKNCDGSSRYGSSTQLIDGLKQQRPTKYIFFLSRSGSSISCDG